MEREKILENMRACREKLEKAAAGPVEICAVTKTQSAQAANLAWEAGITRIGENRVQELMEKLPALNPHFQVDLIGQLQTNKVKYIVDRVARVQSLDRMDLAREIDKRAQAKGRVMDCLVQVNIAREKQKAGLDEGELCPFLEQAAKLQGLRICGLMAVMPLVQDPEEVRPYFRRMRTWFERLKEEAPQGVEMQCLSMGMSGDYLVAAQEGATLVRLGSALFGARPAHP